MNDKYICIKEFNKVKIGDILYYFKEISSIIVFNDKFITSEYNIFDYKRIFINKDKVNKHFMLLLEYRIDKLDKIFNL